MEGLILSLFDSLDTDSILSFAVVLGPFFFAVVIEVVSERIRKQSLTWRISVITFGVILSLLTWWQQARDRAKALGNARDLKEQIAQQTRYNDQRLSEVTNTMHSLLAQTSRPPRPASPPQKFPTAEEIATAVGEKLKQQSPPPKFPVENLQPQPIVKVAPPVLPQTEKATTITQCFGDRLNECSDEQLLEWGKPLMAKIGGIKDSYTADTKKLDGLKGKNWFFESVLEIVGTGDKTSKWLKGMDDAAKTAADRFRDCCAKDVLAYQKELARRQPGGARDTKLYEWVQNLMAERNSKAWKKARADGDNVGILFYDLDILQINLSIAMRQRAGL